MSAQDLLIERGHRHLTGIGDRITLEAFVNGEAEYERVARSQAAFPLEFVREKKFWPSISRINNTYGDRNLICTCEPIESYQEAGVN